MILRKLSMNCSLVFVVIILFHKMQSSLFIAGTNLDKREMRYQNEKKQEIECADRGDRIEGINCPKEVAGAYIELEAALIVPLDRKQVTAGDSIQLRFLVSEGHSYVVEVKEKRTNYLMKPKLPEIKDGIFTWSVNEVLVPLATKVRINYDDLLSLAYRQDSTPQLAYVRPIALSHTNIAPTIDGYHFIFRANADIVIRYQFYRKVGQLYRELGKERRLTKPAENSFLIAWNCKIDDNFAPDGEYSLKLYGDAAVGPSYEPIEAQCYFYHKQRF